MSASQPAPRTTERKVLELVVAGYPEASRSLSLSALERFPHRTYSAVLDDESSVSHWQGVPLSLLFDEAQLSRAKRLRVEALNDFSALIPLNDLTTYEPILAYRRDDRYIGISERGPLFIIYPQVRHPELCTQLYFNRSVWQVSRITLE